MSYLRQVVIVLVAPLNELPADIIKVTPRGFRVRWRDSWRNRRRGDLAWVRREACSPMPGETLPKGGTMTLTDDEITAIINAACEPHDDVACAQELYELIGRMWRDRLVRKLKSFRQFQIEIRKLVEIVQDFPCEAEVRDEHH